MKTPEHFLGEQKQIRTVDFFKQSFRPFGLEEPGAELPLKERAKKLLTKDLLASDEEINGERWGGQEKIVKMAQGLVQPQEIENFVTAAEAFLLPYISGNLRKGKDSFAEDKLKRLYDACMVNAEADASWLNGMKERFFKHFPPSKTETDHNLGFVGSVRLERGPKTAEECEFILDCFLYELDRERIHGGGGRGSDISKMMGYFPRAKQAYQRALVLMQANGYRGQSDPELSKRLKDKFELVIQLGKKWRLPEYLQITKNTPLRSKSWRGILFTYTFEKKSRTVQ